MAMGSDTPYELSHRKRCDIYICQPKTMLSKLNRLVKDKDFENVFKTGKTVKNNFLFLRWTENNLNTSRFGFVVSNKISKKAAIRHKIKRRLRELVRLKISKMKKGFDGVFIAKKGIEKLGYQELDGEMEKLLGKLR